MERAASPQFELALQLCHNRRAMSILVFANGDLQPGPWLTPYLAAAEAIVAADGGTRHLLALDRVPDILIGDLDSLDGKFLDACTARGTQILAYPDQKDETDLELALLYAVRREDWRELPILVFGVLGGRLDQTLANVLLLAHPLFKERHIRLVEPFQQAWLIAGTTTIQGEPGDRISLIPLTENVVIGSTAGLQWSLENEPLLLGPSRGISNVITENPVSLTVTGGLALCIHIARDWQR